MLYMNMDKWGEWRLPRLLILGILGVVYVFSSGWGRGNFSGTKNNYGGIHECDIKKKHAIALHRYFFR